VRGANVADAGGERARVYAGNAGDVAGFEPGVQAFEGAPVGGLGDLFLYDQATGGDAGGLHVFGIGASVADVRESETDDLAGVGGVGQSLLVAGHAGVETDLAGLAGAVSAETDTPEDCAVGQD